MPNCRIVTAASEALLRKEARQWIGQTSLPLILLTPSPRAAEDLLYGAAGTGFFGIYRYTLRQLAGGMAAPDLFSRGLSPVSSLGAKAILAKVVNELDKQGAIPYFAPVCRTPGFLRSLLRTVEDLRLGGARPEEVGETGAPGQDLARILSAYGGELRERGLADYAQILEIAAEIRTIGRHAVSGLPLVAFCVAAETSLERQLLAALIEQATGVLVTLPQGDRPLVEFLEERFEITAEALSADSDTALDRLRSRLFETEAGEGAGDDGTWTLFSASNESLECVEIVRRLHRAAEEGLPFDRAAVLLRHPDRYQPPLEEAFRRAGIPAWFSKGVLRPHPAGRAFLTLLECAREGCSAERFAEYLSLGQVPEENRKQELAAKAATAWTPPADDMLLPSQAAQELEIEQEQLEEPEASSRRVHSRAWERLLLDAAVIGGVERWRKRLAGLYQELELRLADAEEDTAQTEGLRRRMLQLSELEQFALPLIEALHALPAQGLWGEWLDALSELAVRGLRQPEAVLGLLAELEPMREAGPAGLEEVYGVLEERLRFLRQEPQLRPFGRVFVGGVEEARGRTFDLVFLPGLAEGLFPARAMEDPLLLDAYRAKLPEQPLPLQEGRVHRERLLLRLAAGCAEKLVASYPRMETAQARARVPSFYALELARAAEGRLPDLRSFEKQAAAGSASRLGWPAPPDPAEAIDAAEYDLAYLEDVLSRPAGEARGAARYLVEANAHLARSLRARYQKWHRAWTAVDGLVRLSPDAVEVLRNHRLTSRPYSASALQLFAACPYRFALNTIFSLRPREELAPLERMDPLTRGSLFHTIQFRLLSEAADREAVFTEANLGRWLQQLDRIATEAASEFADRLAPLIPQVWESEVESLKGDLRGWLREVAQWSSGWRPLHSELSFGIPLEPGHDPASRPEPVVTEGFQLRGSIDLVETQGRNLRVTDHKTGRFPEERVEFVGGGRYLQPLLYALAAEEMLGRRVQTGRLSYCTQRGGYQTIQVAVNDLSREKIRKVLSLIDQYVLSGFLPAAPAPDACARCDYRLVCGPYEEIRVKRKPKADIASIQALRGEA